MAQDATDTSSPASWPAGPAGRATLALIGVRVIYAYNWFDVGPALPAIGGEFHVGPAAWGLLLAAFFVGAGALQLPAGLLARRWGTRAVSLVGAALLGGSALACSLAPDFAVLVLLRGLSGAGAGLFFSPAIALVASLHREGRRGVPVGVFSSAYSAGAGLGVLATALLLPTLGWRGSLALGGLVMLLLLAIATAFVPRGFGAPEAVAPGPSVPRAWRARSVWAVGLSFIGLEGASLSAGQFFVPFAETARGWSPALAGGIGALFVFPSFFGGPVGGSLAERYANRRLQMLVFTAVPASFLALVPWLGVIPTALVAIGFAFSYGMVYAMMYILPAYLPGIPPSETSLAIGLFNGVQLAGGAGVAFLVGTVVGAEGYDTAWVLLAGITVATLVFLAAVPRTGRAPELRPNVGEGR